MSKVIKATLVTCIVILILSAGLLAMAAKPAFTGMKMPPALDGMKGAVTGRVTSSANTTGLVGAYIAVVNASNVSEEYFNTTSGADGYYQIIGLNATYNATNESSVGPNGATPYRIYAYHPLLGEGYSAAFGIDSSGPATGAGGIPPVTVAATPTPTATAVPTATPVVTSTPVPTVTLIGTTTAIPTATPVPSPYVFPQVLAVLFAGCVAAFLLTRRKNN